MLRNQTQFNYVNTNVKETSPNAIGIVRNDGFTATPVSGLPLNHLSVRQQSRDRNIYDISVYNQTELNAKFATGPLGHTLLVGAELGFESYQNQAMSRTGKCVGVQLATGFVACTTALDPNNSSGSTPVRPSAILLNRRRKPTPGTSTIRSISARNSSSWVDCATISIPRRSRIRSTNSTRPAIRRRLGGPRP